jgi:hypothetical protein
MFFNIPDLFDRLLAIYLWHHDGAAEVAFLH